MFGYPLSLPAAALTGLVALALVAEAARRCRWNASAAEHLRWALATSFVLLGHRMSVRLETGLELHYLGSAFLALLLGYPRAVVSMALVLAIQCAWPPSGAAFQPACVSTLGIQVLLAALLPVWTMWLVVSASRRWLPRNLFVFLLGCGLLGLFLCYAVQIAGTALVFAWLAQPVPPGFLDEFVPYALLLAAGEAWIEGMLTSVLVVYVPGSVRLFDESFYLGRQ